MTRSLYGVFAAVWAVIILIALSVPGNQLPQTSIWNYSYAIHAGIFMVLAWLWMHAIDYRRRFTVWVVLLVGIGFGAATEIYQGLLPYDRTADPLDAACDALGFAVGVAAFYLYPYLFRRSDRVSR